MIKVFVRREFVTLSTAEQLKEIDCALRSISQLNRMVFKAAESDEGISDPHMDALAEIDAEYFKRWYKGLSDEIAEYIKLHVGGNMTEADWMAIRGIIAKYKIAFLYNVAGVPGDVDPVLIDPKAVKYPEITYKIGLMSPKASEGIKSLIAEAAAIQITKIDLAAVESMKLTAKGFLTPLVNQVGDDMEKILTAEEEMVTRHVIAGLAQKLNPRVVGRLLGNEGRANKWFRDYERVARTQMMDWYNQGLWQHEKRTQDVPHYDVKGAVDGQRLVFKPVDDTACKWCRNIWAHEDLTPKLYLESDIEGAPSNYGLKPEKWTAQVGVIHPNCREGGLRVAKPGITNIVYPQIFKKDVVKWTAK